MKYRVVLPFRGENLKLFSVLILYQNSKENQIQKKNFNQQNNALITAHLDCARLFTRAKKVINAVRLKCSIR